MDDRFKDLIRNQALEVLTVPEFRYLEYMENVGLGTARRGERIESLGNAN